MSTDAVSVPDRWTDFEQLSYARQIIQTEVRSLAQVAKRLDREFCRAVQYIYECRGNVIVTGMGKAGLIGQKIMATLASTGTPSHCLHPAEAVHGDLGRIHREDVLLVLSQSGETEEIVRVLPALQELGVPILAITAEPRARWAGLPRWSSTWARSKRPARWAWPRAAARRRCWPWATPWRWSQPHAEVRPRGFRPLPSGRQPRPEAEQGRAPHAAAGPVPRGARGARRSARCSSASSVPGRRTGATMLVAAGRLSGIFTDSDLARLFEQRRDENLDGPIAS